MKTTGSTLIHQVGPYPTYSTATKQKPREANHQADHKDATTTTYTGRRWWLKYNLKSNAAQAMKTTATTVKLTLWSLVKRKKNQWLKSGYTHPIHKWGPMVDMSS
jgi:hypothetical protein